MARFRFRLEKVLDLRARAEKEAARRLGALLAQRDLCAREVARLDQDRRSLLARRGQLQQGRILPANLNQNRYQLLALERAAVTARARLGACERELGAARALLAEKRRQRRLVEKLKEHRRLSWETEEKRREQRALDDRPQTEGGMTIAWQAPDPDRG